MLHLTFQVRQTQSGFMHEGTLRDKLEIKRQFKMVIKRSNKLKKGTMATIN